MTALSQITAGARLTAAMLRGVAPLAAYKGADESVTSSTTLQNDDALFVTVLANSTYLWVMYLDYEGGTGSSSDLKVAWSLPSGTTLRATWIGLNSSGGNTASLRGTESTTATFQSNGAGSSRAVLFTGTLNVSSTPGNMQLQWAQNTSNGTATKVHAGSVLALWQIA